MKASDLCMALAIATPESIVITAVYSQNHHVVEAMIAGNVVWVVSTVIVAGVLRWLNRNH
jgi:hypothetical protein